MTDVRYISGHPVCDVTARGEIPAVDSTLSTQGAAADAKAAGDKVAELKSAIYKSNIGERYFSVKNDTYISSTTGAETYYSGWKATDFIPIDDGASQIKYYSPGSNTGKYNAFYSSDKSYIPASSFESKSGVNYIPIPSGAAYFRLSGANSIIDGTQVFTKTQNEVDGLSNITRQIANDDRVANCLITVQGNAAASDLWDSTDFIPIFANGNVTFRCYIYGNGSLCFYDVNKSLLLGINGDNASQYGAVNGTAVQTFNFTPPSGTRFVRMCVWKNYASLADLSFSYECKWADNAAEILSAVESVNPIIKGYSDKKVLVIGDSISTDSYGNYKKWVTNLIEDGKLSLSNTTNSSQHATGFVARYNNQPNDFISRLEAIADKSSYDVVIVFGGINDYIQNIPLGGGTGETDKTVYFKPAVDYFFQYLVNNFTQARICVLLPLRTYNIWPNTAGNKQEVYAEYIHDVAKNYCLPVLNLTEESGFCPFVDSFKAMWTLIPSGYTDPDGTHPNAQYEKEYLAPMIWKFISGLID